MLKTTYFAYIRHRIKRVYVTVEILFCACPQYIGRYTCLLSGATVLIELWPPHILYVFSDKFLQDGVVSPTPNPPTWRSRVSLLFWHIPRNLSGMGGRTSSYDAASIALVFIVVHKPPHPATKCFRQGGDTMRGLLHYFSLKTESRSYEVTRICQSVRLCVPSNCFEVNMVTDVLYHKPHFHF
jgi:hypothetical protein